MKLKAVPLSQRFILVPLLLLLGVWLPQQAEAAAPTIIYSTGFEAAQGYLRGLDLEGQQGWLGTGGNSFGDNGVTLNNYLPGLGQSAYIGSIPLAFDQYSLYVWHPLNISPLASNTPIVRFSVSMKIVDSSNGEYDTFRWSVFTQETNELFDLVFDNNDLSISYLLQNSTNFISTGQSFDNDTLYALVITMDFGRGKWGATLDNITLVTDAAMTTANSPLTLGDLDAVWVYRDFVPGDNFMVFDNYQITAAPAPQLQVLPKVNNQFRLGLAGESSRPYALEANTNLANTLGWTSLQTNITALDGTTQFSDPASPGLPRRFYRVRLAQ